MSERRRRDRNHFRTSTRDRLVEVGESLWYPAVLRTPLSTFGVRTYQTHDFEACSS